MSIFLTSVSDLLTVQPGSAGTIQVHASWIDVTGSPAVASPNRTNTADITTTTETTIVASPAASTQRNLKFCSISNVSTTSPNAVTVRHTDGTNKRQICTFILQPGDAWHFNELTGWSYIPSTNSVPVSGRLLKQTFVSSGTTFTTGHFTYAMRVRGCGGGSGGGGTTNVASASGAGGGGGAGSYAEKYFAANPDTTYSYTLGTAGAGNSAAAGGNGGDGTFVVGALTLTVKGATGAAQRASSTSAVAGQGGAGGIAGTNGDINSPGAPGFTGLVLSVTSSGAGGNGGSGLFGAGGQGAIAAGNGSAAAGFGAGGGGGLSINGTAQAGGSGTAGCYIVEEFS